jgi:hypothetical protein
MSLARRSVPVPVWAAGCLVLLALVSSVSRGAEYATDFDATEYPLSEGGRWLNGGANGVDWTDVRSANGIACGTQDDADGYDDSFAHLTGFAPDHWIEGTVFRSGSFTDNQEVELLLRWASQSQLARGYEVLWPWHSSSGQIVRWNGDLGDFTVLGSVDLGGVPQDGDVLRAEIVGDTITIRLNGNPRDTVPSGLRDTTWTDGNPGIGFFTRNPVQNDSLCFTAIRAADGDATSPPPPRNLVVQ